MSSNGRIESPIRAWDVKLMPADNGRTFIYNRRSGAVATGSAAMAQTIAWCQSPGTIAEQAERIARWQQLGHLHRIAGLGQGSLGERLRARVAHYLLNNGRAMEAPRRSVEAIRHELAKLHEAGFLRDDDQLLEMISRSAVSALESQHQTEDEANPDLFGIGVINIVGSGKFGSRRALRDRTLAARRLNVGRTKVLIINECEAATCVRASARERVLFLRSEQHLAFASQLKRYAGVPDETLAFGAVGGSEEVQTTPGARNILLLDSARHLSVQIMAGSLQSTQLRPDEPTVAVSSAADAFAASDSRENFALEEGPHNGIALHKGHLGERPFQYVGPRRQASVRIDQTFAPSFVSCLAGPGVRIGVTMSGTWSSVGVRPVNHSLAYAGPFLVLLPSLALDAPVAQERRTASRVKEIVLSDRQVPTSPHLGLDHRRLLPPFPVVSEDAEIVWSAAARVCCPGVFRVCLPYEAQTDDLPDGVNWRRQYSFPRMSHGLILANIIASFGEWHGPAMSEGESMRELGRYLQALSRMGQVAFHEFARSLIGKVCNNWIMRLSRILEEDTRRQTTRQLAAEAWVGQIECALAKELVARSEMYGAARSRGAPYGRLSNVLRAYGELLEAWPDLVAATESFRRSDGHLASFE